MFRTPQKKGTGLPTERILDEFRRRGMRVTPQRMAIVSILEGNGAHPTAEDIFREVKKRFPGTTPATVYNTVSALSEIGALRPVTFGGGTRRYDPNTAPHHHFICERCGLIEDVMEPVSGDRPRRLRTKRGYRLRECRVTFYGACAKCLGISADGARRISTQQKRPKGGTAKWRNH